MSAYTIGIDIGTGSTKGIAIDENGIVLLSFSVSYPTHISNHYHEQNPEKIAEAFVACIQHITKALGSPISIGISSAMHSVLLINAEGSPLTSLITWADGRAISQAKELQESAVGEKIYCATGTPIHPMSPLCKIAWFKTNEAEKLKTAHKIIGIKEFIWWKFFGVYEIDCSIASATGMFDIHSKDWSALALEHAGITSEQLSTPVATDFNRQLKDSKIIQHLGVDVNTKFIIGASDGCLANLGSNAIESGTAALTIGTSGAIRVASAQPVADFASMPFSYILDNHTFIIGGPINNGGSILKWFIHEILQQDESVFEKLLEKTSTIKAGSEGLLFLPYLMGERAPIWDADASGLFMGVRNYHSQTHFVKALMEGVCLALYDVGESLRSKKIEFKKIHVSGGIVRSKEWLQIIADVFNNEVCLLDIQDASALGAAYLANPKIQRNQVPSTIFYPNLEAHQTYQQLYTVFSSLYKKLKPEMNSLSLLANL